MRVGFNQLVCMETSPNSAEVIQASGKGDPQKSAITNGNKLLPGVDGRSPWVRRAKDLINAHLSDLGGRDNTSVAEQSLVRRAATMTVELEALEAKFAQAGHASVNDLDLYSRTASNLRRIFESLGLERRPRNITPTLSDILRETAP